MALTRCSSLQDMSKKCGQGKNDQVQPSETNEAENEDKKADEEMADEQEEDQEDNKEAGSQSQLMKVKGISFD